MALSPGRATFFEKKGLEKTITIVAGKCYLYPWLWMNGTKNYMPVPCVS